ncbi:hypothetical protein CFI10_11490 [Marinobacterium iners]|uniref:hypothetical protein n=1 Tax=Marinobacterium iners TaxID=48076 RepID=UPI001A8E9D9E|nr:hypothetical protein [Marinobacterium iners]QSR35612.1 hypothetical protein CFI10_11490 [Marinobacterium iners]
MNGNNKTIKKYLIILISMIPVMFSGLTLNAENVSGKKAEAQEYCQQVRSGEIAGNYELQQRAVAQGWICNEDLATNSLYAAFGENTGSENLKAHGYDSYSEIEIKHENNKPFWDTISVFLEKAMIYIGVFGLGYFLLIHVALRLAAGKELNNSNAAVYTLVTGIIGFKGMAIIFFVVSVSIILANRLTMFFLNEIEVSDYNQIVSDKNIVAIEMNNANEFIAMSLQADRTGRVNQGNFNNIFSDDKSKAWYNFIDQKISKSGSRERVLSETAPTYAASVDNELYIEFFRFSASIRKFVDKLVLLKNDEEKKFDYEEDWYGYEGTYGSVSVQNNVKDLEGRFATGEVDNQSEIQEAAEQALLSLSRSLANDTQLEILYTQIRKQVENKINASGKSTLELSDINASITNYLLNQMQPAFNQAMSQANIVDPKKRQIFAQMMAGQIVSMMQGASYSELEIESEMGATTYSQPRFLDIQRVFVQPFIKQADLYSCSGKNNYLNYVAPNKSKVELYNTIPESTSQYEVLEMTDYINTACVNVTETGLELIGSYDEQAQDEALKQMHIEKLTLAMYLSAIKKAGVIMAQEQMSKENDWLRQVQLHGFLGLFIKLKDILSADDSLNFGREYLTNTVTYSANVDYGIKNYFINDNVLNVEKNDSVRRRIEKDYPKIDLSSVFRAGTVLQPRVNTALTKDESAFAGSFLSMDDILEFLLFVDLTPVKQMACVDTEKSFAEGIAEKKEDRINYEKGNYKCVDLMTGTQTLGKNLIETGIFIKVSKASVDALLAGMDSAEELAGLKNGKAATVSKMIPWKLVAKGILIAIAAVLVLYNPFATLMIIAGVMFQYLTPLSAAIAGISAMIAYFGLIFRAMVTLVYEILTSAIKGDHIEEKAYKALIAAYPQTTRNLIALLLTPSILVLGLMLFVVMMNSIGTEIIVTIIESIFSVTEAGIFVQALLQVGGIIIFLVLVWIVIQMLINEFIKKFPETILSIFNVSFRFEAQIDKAVEQLIAGGMVTNTIDSGLNAAKAGSNKVTQMIKERKEQLKNAPTAPQQNAFSERTEQPVSTDTNPSQPEKVDEDKKKEDADK